jgi:hypothetical protein
MEYEERLDGVDVKVQCQTAQNYSVLSHVIIHQELASDWQTGKSPQFP